MKLDRKTGLAGGAFALAAATLACVMLAVAPARRPQAATGDDALSVAFGDARRTISAALVHKADSYYHGGVEMDGGHRCELDGHGDHDSCGDDHCRHDPCGHDSCDHDHDGHAPARPSKPQSDNRNSASLPDPWRWINDRVRAPQVERHLEGRRAVEMIPLLWASVRADPRNIDAWTTAWYIAGRTMRDAELAEKILDEGLRLNPDEPELLFTRARGILSAKGDRSRARDLMRKARSVLFARCGGQLGELSPADAETWRHLEMFLANLP